MKFILLIIYLAGLFYIAARLGRALNSARFEEIRREEDPLGQIDNWTALLSMVIAIMVVFWPISILLIIAMRTRERM